MDVRIRPVLRRDASLGVSSPPSKAPMLTAAGMGARASKGVDTLYKHAIEGFTGAAGVMPAKGGNPALTDEQVKATVDWMVNNLQ